MVDFNDIMKNRGVSAIDEAIKSISNEVESKDFQTRLKEVKKAGEKFGELIMQAEK